MSKLFSAIALGKQVLENRIVIPPMCTYSAENGMPTPWHLIHYGSLSHSGAGLLIVEATAICPEGRLSSYDLGLWDESTQLGITALLANIKQYSSISIAVQLVHAGRKASMSRPWDKIQYIPVEEGGWKTVAPSPIAFSENYDDPKELTLAEINTIINQFVEAAKRADKAGFDAIELHAAHGYLLHQFLSPLSNHRIDQYGGSLENRMRLVLDVFKAVRHVFPVSKAVGVRISALDWVEGGWDLAQSLELATLLKLLGCDFIHVSTGGLHKDQKIPIGPNYQVPFAQTIKEQVGIPTIAVGLITEPMQAEAIVSTGQADMVAIGRGMLYNPRWAWHAATELNGQVIAPAQYLRCQPHGFKQLFK